MRSLVAALLAVGISAAAAQTPAAAYPAQSLRFMVGFGPGGSTDLLSRLFVQKRLERLGQPMDPDLKTGATGRIAADALANARRPTVTP